MNRYTLIYRIGMLRSKKRLIAKYGRDFYKRFSSLSSRHLSQVIPKTPSIGNTIFSFNYAFTPAYIAWYKAAREIGLGDGELDKLLWLMNERIIAALPKCLAKLFMKIYLKNFRKRAPEHEMLCKQGKVHDYDYILRFRDISETTFEIDIRRCGMMTLAKDFEAEGIFPAVCRVDYMMSAYMGAGFERTKTLGDGDDCCNCRYILGGRCQWPLEDESVYK